MDGGVVNAETDDTERMAVADGMIFIGCMFAYTELILFLYYSPEINL